VRREGSSRKKRIKRSRKRGVVSEGREGRDGEEGKRIKGSR
jgi:hypothetical protein